MSCILSQTTVSSEIHLNGIERISNQRIRRIRSISKTLLETYIGRPIFCKGFRVIGIVHEFIKAASVAAGVHVVATTNGECRLF